MFTLITGGVRSGKSLMAHQMADAHDGPVIYALTAHPIDEEMDRRIAQHRQRRPETWRVVELDRGVQPLVKAIPTDALVVFDCFSVFVSNLVLGVELTGDIAAVDQEWRAYEAVRKELEAFAAVDADQIVVTNEVGMGVVPPAPLGRLFRDVLGNANQWLAEHADRVLLMVAGLPLTLKEP